MLVELILQSIYTRFSQRASDRFGLAWLGSYECNNSGGVSKRELHVQASRGLEQSVALTMRIRWTEQSRGEWPQQ